MVLGLHEANLREGGYELYAHAAVTSISPSRGLDGWAVKTVRGTVHADKVIFASNAYTQAIVPEDPLRL